MKKTIFTVLVGLIIISTFVISTISTSTDIIKETEDDTYYLAATYGPSWLKIFTKIEIISGNQTQINKINELLTRHRLEPGEEKYAIIQNLTFKVTYKLPTTLLSRFLYRSIYTKINFSEYLNFQEIQSYQDTKDFLNNSIETIKNNTNITKSRTHSYTYVNFTGFFYLRTPRMLRIVTPKLFIPAKFAFMGVCEDLIKN